MTITNENLLKSLDELETLMPELPVKRVEFAESLIKQGRKRKELSDKQLHWVGKLMEIAIKGEPKPPTETVGELSGLVKLFEHAKEHLKYPKIWVEIADTMFKLNLSGPTAKKPGWVTITDGKPFGQNKWFGRISPEGTWDQPHVMGTGVKKLLRRLLKEFSEDAAAAATKYGHLSGNCCFCNIPIGEGDDQRSVDAGYGPVCAKNYGLPWGKKS